MAFCSNCGAKIDEGVRFCSSCGKAVAGVPNESVALINNANRTDGYNAGGTFAPNVSAMPVFDKPNSIIIDAWTVGKKYNDFVIFFNSSKRPQASFNVYGYNGTWALIGPAFLRTFGDRDMVKQSPYNRHLKQFRYFAVESLDGYTFNIQVAINHNDLYLTVFE